MAAEVADEPTPPVREPASGGGNGAAPDSAEERTTEQPAAGGPVYAGPGARRLARELGVDLGAVKGTGRKGRIPKADVEAAAKGAQAAAEAKPAAPAGGGAGLGLCPWPKVDFAKYGEIERVPLSRIQKISGAEPAPQLGDDPARHPPRRGGHHRPRGVPQADQRRSRPRA